MKRFNVLSNGFREGFTFLLGKIDKEVLKVKLYDFNTDKVFGHVELPITELLNDPDNLRLELGEHELADSGGGKHHHFHHHEESGPGGATVTFSARLMYLVPNKMSGKEKSHSVQKATAQLAGNSM